MTEQVVEEDLVEVVPDVRPCSQTISRPRLLEGGGAWVLPPLRVVAVPIKSSELL